MSRREMRLRAVIVTTAACRSGPNADPATSVGSSPLVFVAQPGQRSRWQRCSVKTTATGGSSETWWRPGRRDGARSDSANSRPQPPHATG